MFVTSDRLRTLLHVAAPIVLLFVVPLTLLSRVRLEATGDTFFFFSVSPYFGYVETSAETHTHTLPPWSVFKSICTADIDRFVRISRELRYCITVNITIIGVILYQEQDQEHFNHSKINK